MYKSTENSLQARQDYILKLLNTDVFVVSKLVANLISNFGYN